MVGHTLRPTAREVGLAASEAGQEQHARVERLLERVYARFGWRLVLASAGIAWIYTFFLGLIGAFTLARIERLSNSGYVQLLGLASLVWASSIVLASLTVAALTRPLAIWIDGGRNPAGGADVWRTVCELPVRVTRASGLALLVVTMPGMLVAAATVGTLTPSLVALIVIANLGILGIGLSVLAHGTQLATRPMLRDLAQRLDHPPLPTGGVSVRSKLLVTIPVLIVAAGFGGVMLGQPTGAHWSGVLQNVAVALPLGFLSVALPAAGFLAHSTLRPLDDLTQATERLKQGDFTTRVPELSADEYGVLARSFNEAMEGLAERQRLAAENERLLEEVRASRARILAASDAERRRIERNIHDGAQQQLVAHALELRMLQEIADSAAPQQIHEMLEAASKNVETALDELRELARGLHPSVLATDGLPPALRQLATRAPVPVTVNAPQERFPESIESTAYFIACEALANIAKYARASNAAITIQRDNGRLVVSVTDDGIGGANQNAGSGLAGLADRVAAVDGTLTLHSPPGRGTTITAELPLDLETP
jgi:signal transduction histidine kinase